MQLFAYIKQKKIDFTKTTLYIKHKKQKRTNLLKNIFVIISFFVCVISYAIIVTISSTKGYFLSQAQKEKEEIQFSYNIETLNMSEYKKKLRDKLEGATKIKKINFDISIVKNKNTLKYALNN